ncbi:unnamed protein product [Toxocara canis]|uniref:Fatty acid hydroxylase domain-containing protein n=1 Tax=Toxocara canis TaxID=6265 RepID=A0A183U332_TOXCA|nr:unnamed protein product [Toxocara canis]
MDVALTRLNLRNLRTIFYLVTPNETTFSHVNEVPRYIEDATSWFIILIIVEIIALHFQRKEHSFALNDTITSISSGVLSLLLKLGDRAVSLALYMYVYNHFRIVDLPVESSLTWFIGFLSQDLVYYLTHRAIHEAGVFWSFHQMHHSSEYYNLSTALRKAIILVSLRALSLACLADYGTILFDVLQSFIVPPPIFLVHRYLNFLYQFWIHTEIITSLGPLEYILNTPSHHRVHHGRNPYCIDKNYGGTLIIWDRLFGTFEWERDSERPIYGAVDNVKTFDQLYLQVGFRFVSCFVENERPLTCKQPLSSYCTYINLEYTYQHLSTWNQFSEIMSHKFMKGIENHLRAIFDLLIPFKYILLMRT